jgi:hypothetical protein
LNSILKNYGSIISIIYFLIYFCFLLTFLIKGINQLKIDLIKKIIEKKKVLNNNNNNVNEKIEHPIIINFNNNLKLRSRKSKKSKILQKSDNPPRKKSRRHKITVCTFNKTRRK